MFADNFADWIEFFLVSFLVQKFRIVRIGWFATLDWFRIGAFKRKRETFPRSISVCFPKLTFSLPSYRQTLWGTELFKSFTNLHSRHSMWYFVLARHFVNRFDSYQLIYCWIWVVFLMFSFWFFFIFCISFFTLNVLFLYLVYLF